MSCVVPVIDYESPTQGTTSEHMALPRAHGSRPRSPQPPPTPPQRGAGGFADAVLRRVLEVIDRRRPLAHLRPLLAGGLVDSLLPVIAGHDGRGAARLRRMRVQPVGTDGSAAEVAATYTRGERLHAIACRIEQVLTPTGLRWQVVALHIG
ncbi:Rv3235 family protein [Mycolicibacterium sp. CBM1]